MRPFTDPSCDPGGRRLAKAFDIEMHDLEGNHVALVERGRVGPEAVVGDCAGGLDFYNRHAFPHRDRLESNFNTRFPEAANIRTF